MIVVAEAVVEALARLDDGMAGGLEGGRFETAHSFFLAPWWWDCMVTAGLGEGARAEFLTHRPSGIVLPLRAGPGAARGGLSGPYTCLFQPLIPPGAAPASIEAASAGFAGPLRRAGLVRLDAIDPEAAWLPPFLAGARAGGLRSLRFDHFGNHHEPLAGRDWDAYLRARSGALRETIRRKTRRTADVGFRIVAGGAALEDAIAGYLDVYARSWKIPEPFPDFNPAMMRGAAAAGALRLALLETAGQVIAAQIWIVAHGTATVVKLAHDEAFKPLSPGTVLTALTIRHLMEQDRVSELDFGRGDDPYKTLWTTQRRQRVGYLLANPLRASGALAIARDLVRQAVARQAVGRIGRAR